jgi:hypothetical protein
MKILMLTGSPYLIAAGTNKEDWAMESLRANYKSICRYLHWEEGGMVLALGSSTRETIENSKYQLMVRNLGRG